jgi:hypothetical protein
MKPPTFMNTNLSHEFRRASQVLGLALCLAVTASAGAADTNQEPARYLWNGGLTLQADAHIFENGFKDGSPEFVSRYTPLRGYDGDDFPGYFVDVSRLNLNLVDTATSREVFGLERNSLAYFNQRNSLFLDPEPLRLELKHSLYRSYQIKPDNKSDPLAGANSIFTAFNDDSFGRNDYYVQRNDVGASLTLRPSAWGHDGSQLGNVDLSYDRSDRNSVRYSDWVATARLVTGTNPNAIRWRGVDQKLIENVNRGGVGLSASPFQWINVYYEFAVEKYDVDLGNDSLAVVSGLPRFPATNPGFRDEPTRNTWQLSEVSLGFIPSTTKLVNQIKFDKNVGAGKLNFGYANVFLDQDEFSLFAMNRGYEQGRIITHSAYANWNMPLSKSIIWDAHINYRLRDNDSTFPALFRTNTAPNGVSQLDFMNPLLDGDSHAGVFGPWIAQIETFKFGTDFTFVLPFAASRIVAGWEHEDTSRDLVFGNPPPGIRRTIDQNEAGVRPDSVNDTFFVNYSARPISNLRLRLNNSLTLGDETGLISEAETGVKSRLALTYSMPKLLKGATVDVFYQLRYSKNDAMGFSSRSNDVAQTVISSAGQEREQLFQSAGLTFTIMPTLKLVNYCGYVWYRDRLEANFLRTSARRYENNWVFLSANASRSVTDAHTAFVGASYEFTSKLTGSVDYSVTAITGELGSGEIETALADDNELDNLTQYVSAGLNYRVNRNWSVGARYGYAVYDDRINSELNSGYHTIGLMASLSF